MKLGPQATSLQGSPPCPGPWRECPQCWESKWDNFFSWGLPVPVEFMGSGLQHLCSQVAKVLTVQLPAGGKLITFRKQGVICLVTHYMTCTLGLFEILWGWQGRAMSSNILQGVEAMETWREPGRGALCGLLVSTHLLWKPWGRLSSSVADGTISVVFRNLYFSLAPQGLNSLYAFESSAAAWDCSWWAREVPL